MQVEIHSHVTKIDIEPVSVVLGVDKSQPNGIKMMHCMRCGEKLLQHMGRIIALYPGMSPATKLPLIARCRNCKEVYAIRSIAW